MNGPAEPTTGSERAKEPERPRVRELTDDERLAWYWSIEREHGPLNDAARAVWLMLRWRTDPVLFAVEALRIVLQKYQIAILLDLCDAPLDLYRFYSVDPNRAKRHVLVPSGHGLGKTRLEAVAIWWHLLCFQFSKTIVTAPTAEQITGQLLGEARKMYRRLKKYCPVSLGDSWLVMSDSIRHINPEYGDWCMLARTSRPDRPESLQGAHALDADDEFGQLARLFSDVIETESEGGILIIFEEASGVPDVVHETLHGSMSEEGARSLSCGNPTRPDGWFADAINKTDHYAVHPLDCRMSDRTQTYTVPYRDFAGHVHQLKIRGFISPDYWQQILEECDHDEDHDRVRVRVRGVKPRSATEAVIKTHWVDDAFKRSAVHEPDAEAIIGLDFGVSSDKHAMAVRRGFSALSIDEWLPRDKPNEVTLDAVRRALDAQEIYKARTIIGDANGPGRGAMEVLFEHFHEKHPELGVHVILFNSGAGALDKKRYYRRRDEMWYKHGRAWLSDARCTLPKVPGLRRQLCAPGYHEDASRRIKVQTKEEIYKATGQPSGNAADALLQTLIPRPPLPPKPKKNVEPTMPKSLERHLKRWMRRHDHEVYIR